MRIVVAVSVVVVALFAMLGGAVMMFEPRGDASALDRGPLRPVNTSRARTTVAIQPVRLTSPPPTAVRLLAPRAGHPAEQYAQWLKPLPAWDGPVYATIDEVPKKVQDALGEDGVAEAHWALLAYGALGKCLERHAVNDVGSFVAQIFYRDGKVAETAVEASTLPASTDNTVKLCLEEAGVASPIDGERKTTTVIQPIQVPVKNEPIYRILTEMAQR